MTRTILSSLAIAATVSMAAPAAEAIELKKGITSGLDVYKSAPKKAKKAQQPRSLSGQRRPGASKDKTGDRSFFVDESGIIRMPPRKRK